MFLKNDKRQQKAWSRALEVPKIGIHILWGGVSKRYLQNFHIFIFWALRGVKSPILRHFVPNFGQNGQI